MLLILFTSIGAVSANENVTFDEIISYDHDVCLEAETYHLNTSENHVILNNSMKVEGIADKTIVDGNGSSLYLDIFNESKKDNDSLIFIGIGDYPKNTGKHIAFSNIIFMNLKLNTWHEMEFNSCNFINVTFTSYELNNTFNNCKFNQSNVKIGLWTNGCSKCYPNYSEFADCEFYNTNITSKTLRTPLYTVIVGSDNFYTTNTVNFITSRFTSSNIILSRNNIRISNSNFTNTKLKGSSNIINISFSKFNRLDSDLHLSQITANNTDINNATFLFKAGYFSKGSEVKFDNVTLNNTKMDFLVNYWSRISNLEIKKSVITNTEINTIESEILIEDCIFNKSNFQLTFTKLLVKNTIFTNDKSIKDTFKTKNQTYMDKWEYLIKTNYTFEKSYFINDTGRYLIKDSNININTMYNLEFSEKNTYYYNDELIFILTDTEGKPVANEEVYLYDRAGETRTAITDENGTVKFKIDKIGVLNLRAYWKTFGLYFQSNTYGIDLILTVHPDISKFEIKKVNFASNTYSIINSFLKIKLESKNITDLSDVPVVIKVYENGKYKTYTEKSDSYGVVLFEIPTKLKAGNHKIKISILNTNTQKTVNIKINKAKTTVKALKLTSKFKKSKYFQVTIKSYKKAVKNVKVKIKVYSGKKYKTYTVKTNKKGIAKINTKNLKIGKHKVIISSKDNNYKISAKSLITIKK